MNKILMLILLFIICIGNSEIVYSYADEDTFFIIHGNNVYSSDGEFYNRCGKMLEFQNGEIYYIYGNHVQAEDGTIYNTNGDLNEEDEE